MKITKITKKYYEIDGEKIYFFKPLRKTVSIKELQKFMDTVVSIDIWGRNHREKEEK